MHEPIFPWGWNGRYRLDQLSIAMAALSCFLSLFLPRYHRNGFFTLVSLFCAALLLLALWRTLSRTPPAAGRKMRSSCAIGTPFNRRSPVGGTACGTGTTGISGARMRPNPAGSQRPGYGADHLSPLPPRDHPENLIRPGRAVQPLPVVFSDNGTLYNTANPRVYSFYISI